MKDGAPFLKVIKDAGIIPGIKVDMGAKDLAGHPGEKITEGLDGLRERLAEYFQNGAYVSLSGAQLLRSTTVFLAVAALKPMLML